MINFQHALRVFDHKPWAAHLYVTEQCNLDCHYCNEYDNSIPHPATADLKKWMDHIRALGVARIGFQGGEPLMHPEIVELVRYAKSIGFNPLSMSTNGFLLTRQLLAGLEEAGLDKLQISVDRMTPIASTRKSMKSVLPKLDWFKDSKIKLQVSGVLFQETLEEMGQVIDTCLDRGIPVHARVVHDDGRAAGSDSCAHGAGGHRGYRARLVLHARVDRRGADVRPQHPRRLDRR